MTLTSTARDLAASGLPQAFRPSKILHLTDVDYTPLRHARVSGDAALRGSLSDDGCSRTTERNGRWSIGTRKAKKPIAMRLSTTNRTRRRLQRVNSGIGEHDWRDGPEPPNRRRASRSAP
jgi:hypothetical protein